MSTRVIAPAPHLLAALALTALAAVPGCGDSGPGVPEAAPDPARGAELFATVCAQCHGPTAEGLPGRGANLRTSPFVAGSTDAELVAMIRGGRPPTPTHPAMPPKGGRLDLTDRDLFDVVAHIRSLSPPTD